MVENVTQQCLQNSVAKGFERRFSILTSRGKAYRCARGVKKLRRPLTLGESCLYVATADTDLGRRGRAGTAVSFAQAGHVDLFAGPHVELGRRYCGIRLTRELVQGKLRGD